MPPKKGQSKKNASASGVGVRIIKDNKRISNSEILDYAMSLILIGGNVINNAKKFVNLHKKYKTSIIREYGKNMYEDMLYIYNNMGILANNLMDEGYRKKDTTRKYPKIDENMIFLDYLDYFMTRNKYKFKKISGHTSSIIDAEVIGHAIIIVRATNGNKAEIDKVNNILINNFKKNKKVYVQKYGIGAYNDMLYIYTNRTTLAKHISKWILSLDTIFKKQHNVKIYNADGSYVQFYV